MAVGAARAAQLVSVYAPFNLADKPAAPLTKAAVALRWLLLFFLPIRNHAAIVDTSAAGPAVSRPLRRTGIQWSSQTLEAVGSPVTLPLYAVPIPRLTQRPIPTSCIHPDGPDLFVPDQLQWMVDFDRAVAAGMALAIPSYAEQYATGFTRLLVLGLQLEHSGQRWPRSAAGAAGPSSDGAAADSSWCRRARPRITPPASRLAPLPKTMRMLALTIARIARCFTSVSDPTQKRDGQWLAEFLGLDPAFVAGVHGSDGVDQMQARAMQTALWPATLGYWMDTLFTPNPGTTSIFSDAVIDGHSRFLHLVRLRPRSAAGHSHRRPALRHSSDTAFSRIQWYPQGRPISRCALAVVSRLACTTCCASSTPIGRR